MKNSILINDLRLKLINYFYDFVLRWMMLVTTLQVRFITATENVCQQCAVVGCHGDAVYCHSNWRRGRKAEKASNWCEKTSQP